MLVSATNDSYEKPWDAIHCERHVGYNSGMRSKKENLIVARRRCDDEREESCHEYRPATRFTSD